MDVVDTVMLVIATMLVFGIGFAIGRLTRGIGIESNLYERVDT